MMAGKKTANAVGGKTARACDSCVRRRARWYCPADDAFLCQSCDGSVHSANQLASRHERVLLELASPKLLGSAGLGSPEPTWHQGLTRRPRTPRFRSKNSLKLQRKNDVGNSSVRLVPEIGPNLELDPSSLDDDDDEEDEERLLYRVPVFDPFETELYNNNACDDELGRGLSFIVENKQEDTCNLDDLQGFDLPTDDMELLEFAADVESLLGKGYDDFREEDNQNSNTNINVENVVLDENRVKVEDDHEGEGEGELAMLGNFDLDANRETLDWDFSHESSMMMMIKEEEKKVVEGGDDDEHMMMMMVSSDECKEEIVGKSSILLKLNYDEVISAWADQGSPWTNGVRPEVNFNGCWPDFMGLQWSGSNTPCSGGVGGGDGGREARVSRYREKRRMRLFSKKIRYEVRKLNAEKRPRMKGRFVKREGNI